MSVEIRMATKEDVAAVADRELYVSARVWAVDYNGQLACLFGRTVRNGYPIVFMNMLQDVRAPKITVFKAAIRGMRVVADRNIPYYAVCSDAIQGAPRFLKALGFNPVGRDNLFLYEGHK